MKLSIMSQITNFLDKNKRSIWIHLSERKCPTRFLSDLTHDHIYIYILTGYKPFGLDFLLVAGEGNEPFGPGVCLASLGKLFILSISVTPCSTRLKIGMLSDRSFFLQNPILTLCGPISHQNKENKKKVC